MTEKWCQKCDFFAKNRFSRVRQNGTAMKPRRRQPQVQIVKPDALGPVELGFDT